MPWLVRSLGVSSDQGPSAHERHVRRVAAEAATTRLDELDQEWPTHRPLIDTLRSQYAHRTSHLKELEQQNLEALRLDA